MFTSSRRANRRKRTQRLSDMRNVDRRDAFETYSQAFIHTARVLEAKATVQSLDENLLETVKQRLVSEFQPEQIWLFGSHAWGTQDENSDVDLMVVVRESEETSVRRAQRAHRCLSGLPMPKDVIVPTRAQLDRYKHLRASLFNQVLSNGRKLYG